MKKIILAFISVAVLAACSKSSSAPKEIFLSKILIDGKPDTEFLYNAGRQLAEEVFYGDNQGVWAPVSRIVYAYDSKGNPKESVAYKLPENKPTSKRTYTLNGKGQIARGSVYTLNGANPPVLSTHIDYEYNADGRVATQSWKDENEVLTSSRELKYYKNGNLRSSEIFDHNGATAEKMYGNEFAASDTTLPESFYNLAAYPVNFLYPYMVSPFVNGYTYDNDQVDEEWKEIITDRKYNSRGLVTEQKVTTKYINPAAPDGVTAIKYEYREL